MKVGVALSLGVLAKSLGVSLAASNPIPENSDIPKITKTDEEWKAFLTPEQYHVLRQEGTERPCSHEYNDNKAEGIYECAGCTLALFFLKNKI